MSIPSLNSTKSGAVMQKLHKHIHKTPDFHHLSSKSPILPNNSHFLRVAIFSSSKLKPNSCPTDPEIWNSVNHMPVIFGFPRQEFDPQGPENP